MGLVIAPNVLFRRGAATALVASTATLPTDPIMDGAVLHLMGGGGIVPTPDTLLADLTAVEAGFSGYAAATPPGSIGELNLALRGVGEGWINEWVATDPSPDPFIPDTVTGWWAESGGNWVIAGTLRGPESVPIAAPLDWIYLLIVLPAFFSNVIPTL
jgi:hypothetical protein